MIRNLTVNGLRGASKVAQGAINTLKGLGHSFSGYDHAVIAMLPPLARVKFGGLTMLTRQEDVAGDVAHTSLVAHLNTLGAVPLTLPPVPVWALAGTLR